jgi:glutamate synthase (NADPH/NADH) small chain
VGTSNRHGAASVTQFELLPQPPEEENKPLVWPYWPIKLRTSSSHDEGCSRDWSVATKELIGENGKVKAEGLPRRVEGRQDAGSAGQRVRAAGRPGAAGHGLHEPGRLDARSVRRRQGCAQERQGIDRRRSRYYTNVPKVFAAGDVRRGQSLVVWAIREGRQAARSVDAFLMGHSTCRADP